MPPTWQELKHMANDILNGNPSYPKPPNSIPAPQNPRSRNTEAAPSSQNPRGPGKHYASTGTRYGHDCNHQIPPSASKSFVMPPSPREEDFDGVEWDRLSDVGEEDPTYDVSRQRKVQAIPPGAGGLKVGRVLGGIVEGSLKGARRWWEGAERVSAEIICAADVVKSRDGVERLEVKKHRTIDERWGVCHARDAKLKTVTASMDGKDELNAEDTVRPSPTPPKDDEFTEVMTVGPSQRARRDDPVEAKKENPDVFENLKEPIQLQASESDSDRNIEEAEPREREGYDSDFDIPGGVDWPLDRATAKKHQAKMRAKRLAYEEKKEQKRTSQKDASSRPETRRRSDKVKPDEAEKDIVEGVAVSKRIVPIWTAQSRKHKESRSGEKSHELIVGKPTQNSTASREIPHHVPEHGQGTTVPSSNVQQVELMRQRQKAEDRRERKARALIKTMRLEAEAAKTRSMEK